MVSRNVHSFGGLISAAVVGAIMAMPAAAQTSTTPPGQTAAPASESAAPPTTANQVGDIVVTAERQASSARVTPIAIAAFTGDTLARLQIKDIQHLADYVPGLHVASHGFSAGAVILAIRGLGATSIAGDPTVAFHVDGQYYGAGRALNAAFYDLTRVEVLKGPQGTLYGRNSTAGVVNLITAAPENEFKANLSAGYGNYNAVTAQGMLNLPLVESKIAARFAFDYTRHDGYQKAAYANGQNIDDANQIAVRGSIQFTPTENLTLRLVADYSHSDINAPGYVVINNPYVTGQIDPRKNYANTNMFQKQRDASFRFIGTWDLGAVTVSNLASYVDNKLHSLVDQDGNNVQVSTAERPWDLHAFQEELRFNGKLGHLIEWQVGGFYYNERKNEYFIVKTDLVPTPGQPPVPPFIFITPAGQLDPFAQLVLDPNISRTESYAVFTNDKVNLSDTVRLTLGARLNHDRKVLTRGQSGAFYQVGAAFTAFTWKAGLDWRPDKNNLLYASVSTGFKSGGANETLGQGNYKPEKVTAYEAGWKGRLLDGRAQINTAAFYYDYKDLQVSIVHNNASLVANSPKSTVYGAEADGQVQVVGNLSIGFSAAYVHSALGNLALACPMTVLPVCPGIPGFFPTGGATLDVSGNRYAQAPRFSASVGAQYAIPLASGTLTPRADYSFKSMVYNQVYADIAPFTVFRQKASYNLDTSLRYEADAGRWFVEGYVKNLTNTLRQEAGFIVPPSAIYASYAPPRTFGVRLGFKFR